MHLRPDSVQRCDYFHRKHVVTEYLPGEDNEETKYFPRHTAIQVPYI